jgi:hypothetical protein
MFSRPLTWGLVAVVLLGLVSGCGKGKTVKVSGVLTWEDGTPVEGATVVFMPKEEGKRQASGFTGKDGTFDLTTFKPGDGALPGDYKIVVTKPDPLGEGTGGSGITAGVSADDHPDPTKAMLEAEKNKKAAGKRHDAKPLIPTAYTQDKTTPLIATIDSSGGKIELKLKKL